jgi:hypothetical protein
VDIYSKYHYADKSTKTKTDLISKEVSTNVCERGKNCFVTSASSARVISQPRRTTIRGRKKCYLNSRDILISSLMTVNVSSPSRSLIQAATRQCVSDFIIIECVGNIDYFLRLNTFLELKVENERLQQRLSDLRKRAPNPLPLPSSSSMPLMQVARPYPAPPTVPRSGEMAQPYYPMSAGSMGGYGNSMMPSVSGSLDNSNITPYGSAHASNPVVDEDTSEEGPKKKKVRTISKS